MAFAYGSVSSQTPTLQGLLTQYGADPIVKSIDGSRKHRINPIGNPKMLISWYSWKNLTRTDFATLTGLDNSATVSKFAALNINSATSTFTFSPIVINNPNLVESKFRFINSFDFAGTVSKTNILDFKEWRTVALSHSVTWVFDKGYYFSDGPRGSKGNKPVNASYTELYDDLEVQFIQKYISTKQNRVLSLNNPQFDDTKDIEKAWLDSVAKYEKLLVKNSFTAKRFGWLKLTTTPLSFNNAKYIVKGTAATYSQPITKIIYTPAVLLSGNYYFALNTGWNFYGSLYAQGMIKDSFSEILSTSEWNKFDPLSDSVLVKSKTQNVFILAKDEVNKKLLPNVGADVIVLFPFKKYIGFGIHFTLGYNGLISNIEDKKTGWIQSAQTGIILSFKDKSGGSTINIEPYYQDRRFKSYQMDNDHLWGAKFSIPFTRLY
ncbi:hypothetical protein GCM10008119_09880 [Pedobacter mendelii]|uniref:Uncharacterized protein n=2 Tax=Pedobacter mendelii TaxID=1908240 RepID=A0ABQ2BET4_9SPHI|nr:hypothetical protein GCM10008119_09880 [Pedobacter mendelii]